MRADRGDAAESGPGARRARYEQRADEGAGVGPEVWVQPDRLELLDGKVEELDDRFLEKRLVDERQLPRPERVKQEAQAMVARVFAGNRIRRSLRARGHDDRWRRCALIDARCLRRLRV